MVGDVEAVRELGRDFACMGWYEPSIRGETSEHCLNVSSTLCACVENQTDLFESELLRTASSREVFHVALSHGVFCDVAGIMR